MKTLADFLSHHPPQTMRPFAESDLAKSLKLLFSVRRLRESLDFNFVLSGRVPAEIAKLVIPEMSEPGLRRRRDELWKNTCLEIFVGAADQSSYLELNISPSGDWNVYAFDDYRSGMRAAEDAHAPLMKLERSLSGDILTWHATLRSANMGGDIARLLASRTLVLGAAAVLEYGSGEREYWALTHAGEKPDFHLRESFRLPL